MITLEIDPADAVSVLQALIREQEGFTQNPTCTPDRIVRIRKVIMDIDKALEASNPCPPGTIAVDGTCADL